MINKDLKKKKRINNLGLWTLNLSFSFFRQISPPNSEVEPTCLVALLLFFLVMAAAAASPRWTPPPTQDRMFMAQFFCSVLTDFTSADTADEPSAFGLEGIPFWCCELILWRGFHVSAQHLPASILHILLSTRIALLHSHRDALVKPDWGGELWKAPKTQLSSATVMEKKDNSHFSLCIKFPGLSKTCTCLGCMLLLWQESITTQRSSHFLHSKPLLPLVSQWRKL